MTTPCDKAPLIDLIIEDNKETHKKLDKVIDVLSAVAVQGERVTTLEKKAEDIENRLRKLEPLRFLFPIFKWLSVVGGVVASAWATYRLGFGG